MENARLRGQNVCRIGPGLCGFGPLATASRPYLAYTAQPKHARIPKADAVIISLRGTHVPLAWKVPTS
jgi:hypothetical protein